MYVHIYIHTNVCIYTNTWGDHFTVLEFSKDTLSIPIYISLCMSSKMSPFKLQCLALH